MDWIRETQRVGLSDEELSLWLEVTDATDDDALTCAAEIWRVVQAEMIPAHARAEWDVIRCELWSDSGRVLLFPAKSPLEARTDRVVVQSHWPTLQAIWDQQDVGVRRSDEELEAILDVLHTRILGVMRAGFEASALRGEVTVEVFIYESHVGTWT